MSHFCGCASSDKAVNLCDKQSKTTDEKCCSVKTLTADSKYFNHHCKADEHHRVKRLKTRKERRRQLRGDCKESSRTKSYLHHCHRQIRNDMMHFQNSCHLTSKKNTSISSAVPAAQEPSIITDSRLIGHHGLFNHEVKSIDIERLLSEQRKHEQTGQQVKEKMDVMSNLSSTSHIPAPRSSDSLLVADADDVVPFKMKAKTSNDCQKGGKNLQLSNQGSDITPGQRPQQHLELSSESLKSFLSPKHSAEMTKTKNTNHAISEKDSESQLTPFAERENVKTSNVKVKRHKISGLEQLYKNQDHQTQTDDLNPSPLQISSSPTADSFDIQRRGRDPEDVSKSVSAVASRLCECLYFPRLRRGDLVSECRAVLLGSLQEKHGPRLQENLREAQRCVRFGMDPPQAVQDREPVMIEEDDLLPPDIPVKITRSRQFKWKCSPQPPQSLHQTAEWLTNPVDEPIRPSFSPRFEMDFGPSEASARDLFACPPTLSAEGKASASEYWGDSFNRSKTKDSVLFDSFENSFMNHTGGARESSFGPQNHYNTIKSLFPSTTQLLDGRLAEPMKIPQEQATFGNDSHSLASSFPPQIHHLLQGNYFQPFSQFSQHLNSPNYRSYHTDMMHYPPSYMLDRSPAPSSSSFLSPEHWSFPPMRLY
ncbi:proline-rich protein 19 [Odontesthes bonariensis]|uniref:proline-rich protein 19 n=1 Tax=Odontesthes bonariensis TaxID=219752 RepID=UPI003F580A24